MNIFVAAPDLDHLNHATGEIDPAYREHIEGHIAAVEDLGHTAIHALRANGWTIDTEDASDTQCEAEIENADGLLAFLEINPNTGEQIISGDVQAQINLAIDHKKPVVLAHEPGAELAYFSNAILEAGHAKAMTLPFEDDPFPPSDQPLQALGRAAGAIVVGATGTLITEKFNIDIAAYVIALGSSGYAIWQLHSITDWIHDTTYNATMKLLVGGTNQK